MVVKQLMFCVHTLEYFYILAKMIFWAAVAYTSGLLPSGSKLAGLLYYTVY